MNTLGKGVCRLSIVPVRAEASEKSEMVTQLLFGDHYSIIGATHGGAWLQIRIFYDDYMGWISANQHYSISEEYFEQISHSDYKISLDVCATMLYKKHTMSIVLGSILPISTQELFSPEEHLAFNGESKSLVQKREYDFLKLMAKKYLNAPYLWGGKTPFGIDCSGFTQQVFKICGYSLKRDAYEQALQGQEVAGLEQAQPGDLAFFTNSKGAISHVGILLEDQHIIHASGKVRIDLLDTKGILNTDTGVYTHTLASLKRILKK
ncbi:C40 family peptidase [Cytophagales bacterium LB-30]|uniref:C40 family peptidase n=1 Tax=Shiella aurantiaca TaxID=3058365 RepID=A0ABT8F846_9BACT|nr:C40 family peptidase [Shiella aurantiaca]MDN4166663.1 C40 family peptidase [Shiella aurantiaca]